VNTNPRPGFSHIAGTIMPNIKKIDHLAILVDDFEPVLTFWRDALGLKVSQILDVPKEKSQVAFLPLGDSEIELVRPAEEDSGLARALEKRGPGMHHICLEVEDIEGMLHQLVEKGIQLINEQPLVGLGGRKYAFIHPKSSFGVLVELYEIPKELGS
jgi:methylmalonyl-CoA/ethylmalonyl-CoA epimerase